MRNICLTVVVVTLVSSGYCHAGPDAAGGHAMLQTAPVVVGQAQPTTEPTLTGGALLQTAQLPTTPEGKVLIRSIRITGTTVFLPEELRLLVAGVEGQELSLAEIEALAARITSYYRSRGYVIARAYVPPQRVQDGILEIAVLEGRIGKVEVQGATHYSAERIKAYAVPPKEEPVFNARQHERGMLLLNDLPGLKVESTLKPGTEVGTTDVVLNVVKDRWITGTVETNNFGSRLNGYYRGGFSADLNNPTGLGDFASVRFVGALEHLDKTWFTRGAYTIPVNMLGTKVGVAYTHAESAIGREFATLGINGSGDLASIFIAHPFIRTQALSLYGQAGFDYKNFKTNAVGTQVNEDTLSVFNIGGSIDVVDGWRGLTSAGVSLQRGVPGFLGSMRATNAPAASRFGAGGEFTKLIATVARLQEIYGPISMFGKLTGQWTDDKLVVPEQFIAGGAGIVRGYPIAEIIGDQGFTFMGEFRWNAPGFSEVPAFGGKTWGDLLQVFAFLDYGEVRTLSPLIQGETKHRDITSTGAGLRFGFPNRFQFSLEYAKPIGPRPSDHRDEFAYFQAGVAF